MIFAEYEKPSFRAQSAISYVRSQKSKNGIICNVVVESQTLHYCLPWFNSTRDKMVISSRKIEMYRMV